MRKKFFLGFLSLLLVAGLTSMVNTPPPPTLAQTCATDWCADNMMGMFPNHGQCVSWCNTAFGPSHSTTPGAVATCHMIRSMGMLEYMAGMWGISATHGACVNYVKNNP